MRSIGGRPQIEIELAMRDVRFSRPRVITVPPEATGLRYLDSGTITVAVAASGAPEIAELKARADAGDLAGLDRMAREAVRNYAAIGRSGRRLYDGINKVPVLGELRYSRKTLRAGMLVGGPLKLALGKVVYNGGDISADLFEFVEYLLPASREGLEAVVIVRSPRLSELEREILGRIPLEHSEIHMGEAVGFWSEAAADVADWAVDAYDRADVERAVNLNTPDIIDKVARDVANVVHDAQDLTKDFWNHQNAAEGDEAHALQAYAMDAADVAEAQAAEADAAGGAFQQAVERLSAGPLSPTASARTLLALRTQLLIEQQIARAASERR
jgi:hypothetical protein